jgi:hypothetical protein
MRAIQSGEVLFEQGDAAIRFFVVVSGELEAVRPSSTTEILITVFRAGPFAGEVNTLSGRRALARLRARQPGEVIELSRENVLALVAQGGVRIDNADVSAERAPDWETLGKRVSGQPTGGRYGFDLCIGQAGIHNSQKVFDFTRTSRLSLVSAGNSSVARLGRSQEPTQTEAMAKTNLEMVCR